MNVFMLGWEFPPFISGGLGTACHGLTRAMSDLGHHVTFVLPRSVDAQTNTHVTLRDAATTGGSHRVVGTDGVEVDRPDLANVSFREIPSTLRPYVGPPVGGAVNQSIVSDVVGPDGGAVADSPNPGVAETEETRDPAAAISPHSGHYGGDMFAEVQRYAAVAVRIAESESFDIVHAHDWMTFPAGLAVARCMGKPLVVHVHSTEFDRSGEHVNQPIYDLERRGVHEADGVIAVSHLTRNLLLARYAAPGERVGVVYNAVDWGDRDAPAPPPIAHDEKIVLFLGRITMQKGPEYFLAAARKVLQHVKNVRFVMAGSGDLIRRSIELAAEMGIGPKVVFTGFLRGHDVARVFKMADLYVMPSVSEPFGIAPLEALSHDVPVLISKQSGVSEVLTHALKVDFWDIDEMANKIIAVLRHTPLQMTLRDHGSFEVRKFTWKDSARKCIGAYERAIQSHARRRAG